jgi:alpha-L-fucosidase
MYNCSYTDFCAAKMGPKRDLVGELAQAVRAAGMVFGLSSHRAENCFFYDGGRKFPSDVQDDKYRGLYGVAQDKPKDNNDVLGQPAPPKEHMDDWLRRCVELVDKYQPQVFWFDWWIQHLAWQPYLQKFGAYYYNRASQWDRGVAINYKHDAFPLGSGVWDVERGQAADIRSDFWQTDTSVSRNSWGYIEGHKYKDVSSIIHDLIDIVSKNGALLLNVGPRPDGSIPEPEQRMLLDIGKWLGVNGEAIYATRPWKTFGEGPTQVAGGSFTDTKRAAFTSQDIRFTTRDGALYATLLGWPDDGKVSIRSLGSHLRMWPGEIKSVRLLGSDAKLTFDSQPDGLRLALPDAKPCEHAFVLRID